MMRTFPILLVMGLFLPIGQVFAQTSDEVIAAWIEEGKSKLPANIQKVFAPGFQFAPVKHYAQWMKEPSLEKLHQLGIPRSAKEGKLKEADRFTLEGFAFVLAEYGSGEFPTAKLYIKKRNAGYKKLFESDECGDIFLWKLGEKLQPFLVVKTSGCGSGWGATLYQMGKDGKLKEVGNVGGWQGNLKFVDIDGDGILEIINSSSTNQYPEDLDAKLKPLKDYQEPPRGPVLSNNYVYQWNGEEFKNIAEFYEQVEW